MQFQILPATALVIALSAVAHADPRFEVDTRPQTAGDVPRILIAGLTPGTPVEIQARRPYPWNPAVLYFSSAVFEADETGTVDPSIHAPVTGSWDGVDPYGLYWSMRPDETEGDVAEGRDPREIAIRVDVAADGIAEFHETLTLGTEAFHEHPVPESFPGAFLYLPEGEGPHPAIIVLGGSEGGDSGSRQLAPQLADHGYAVMGLPYYSPAYWGGEAQFPELPAGFVNIRVEYLGEARDWLSAQNGIDSGAIAVFGASKGAEYALLGGWLLGGFAAIAAVVPSDVVWEGWGPGSATGQTPSFSWQGAPLDFVPYQGMDEAIASISRGENPGLREPHQAGRDAHPERVDPARIRVEDIAVPVFVTGGGLDRTWPSDVMTTNILEVRDAAGLETVAIVFPDAGHGLSGPPTLPSNEADARAREIAFPRLLRFLEETLRAAREE